MFGRLSLCALGAAGGDDCGPHTVVRGVNGHRMASVFSHTLFLFVGVVVRVRWPTACCPAATKNDLFIGLHDPFIGD